MNSQFLVFVAALVLFHLVRDTQTMTVGEVVQQGCNLNAMTGLASQIRHVLEKCTDTRFSKASSGGNIQFNNDGPDGFSWLQDSALTSLVKQVECS